jgi:hypothetical protein
MSKADELFDKLEKRISGIAHEKPEAKSLVALSALRRTSEIINDPNGIGTLLAEGKVTLQATERGSTNDAERATRDLKTLLNTIKSACRMAGIGTTTLGKG